jgi:hypothetical protein
MIRIGYIEETTQGWSSYNGSIRIKKLEKPNTLHGQKMEIK